MELDFPSSEISVSQFFGPLDVDVIESSNTYLDRVMNFNGFQFSHLTGLFCGS